MLMRVECVSDGCLPVISASVCGTETGRIGPVGQPKSPGGPREGGGGGGGGGKAPLRFV